MTRPSSAKMSPDTADWWWTVVAANSVAFVVLFFLNESDLGVPVWSEGIVFILSIVVLTAPAVVAISVHFDRKYVVAVSDWEPRSEYILLGLTMWLGFGVPIAVLYLYRRHKYVGVP